MITRTLSFAVLVSSFALPGLARAQPAVTAPAAAAPAATSAPAAEPTAVVVTPNPTAAVVTPSPTAVAVAPSVPPPVPTPRIASPSLRSGKKMIIVGASTLASIYFLSTLAGALAIDGGRDDRETDPSTGMPGAPNHRRMRFGRSLLIPIAGPFIAIAHADTAALRWAMVMTGMAQVTTAVLVVAGSIRTVRARRQERMWFGAGPAQGGAMISLRGRF